MKKFDLQAALAGEPVVTRDGRKVLQIAHFPTAELFERVIAQIEGEQYLQTCYEDGNTYTRPSSGNPLLYMAPKQTTVWVNVYQGPDYFWSCVRATQEDADKYAKAQPHRLGNKAHPITIEE